MILLQNHFERLYSEIIMSDTNSYLFGNNATLIDIEHLSFDYASKKIFDDVSFQIPKGKIVGIMGPSGTGKTTLLRLIGAQLAPEHGQILYKGKNIHQMNRKTLFKLRQNMGLLFQSGALFSHLNLFENVAFPLREHTQLSEDIIHILVLMKLQVVGLRGAKELMPSEISGGMARRAALARALVLDPELMMYDEPFTGLDPISKAVIVKLIKEINLSLGTTSILVSHDVPEVMMLADYVYLLSEGKIIAQGSPSELENSTKQNVRQFMQGLPDGTVPFHYPAEVYDKELLS